MMMMMGVRRVNDVSGWECDGEVFFFVSRFFFERWDDKTLSFQCKNSLEIGDFISNSTLSSSFDTTRHEDEIEFKPTRNIFPIL